MAASASSSSQLVSGFSLSAIASSINDAIVATDRQRMEARLATESHQSVLCRLIRQLRYAPDGLHHHNDHNNTIMEHIHQLFDSKAVWRTPLSSSSSAKTATATIVDAASMWYALLTNNCRLLELLLRSGGCVTTAIPDQYHTFGSAIRPLTLLLQCPSPPRDDGNDHAYHHGGHYGRYQMCVILMRYGARPRSYDEHQLLHDRAITYLLTKETNSIRDLHIDLTHLNRNGVDAATLLLRQPHLLRIARSVGLQRAHVLLQRGIDHLRVDVITSVLCHYHATLSWRLLTPITMYQNRSSLSSYKPYVPHATYPDVPIFGTRTSAAFDGGWIIRVLCSPVIGNRSGRTAANIISLLVNTYRSQSLSSLALIQPSSSVSLSGSSLSSSSMVSCSSLLLSSSWCHDTDGWYAIRFLLQHHIPMQIDGPRLHARRYHTVNRIAVVLTPIIVRDIMMIFLMATNTRVGSNSSINHALVNNALFDRQLLLMIQSALMQHVHHAIIGESLLSSRAHFYRDPHHHGRKLPIVSFPLFHLD